MKRIERELLYSLAERPKTFWELLLDNNSLLKDFIKTINVLYSSGIIRKRGEKLYLTEKGRKLVNKRAKFFLPVPCRRCREKGFLFSKELEKVYRKFRRIVKSRPTPTPEFFQGCVLARDTVARVAFMNANHDVADRSILLVGDDDLLSIALALTELPRRIVVVDIDSRLGELIGKVNKKYRFNIEFVEYDVAEPLPTFLRRKFDVFSTEPLETTSGFLAFLARGAAALKRNGVGYVGLTRLEVSLKRWKVFEQEILKMNFVITHILPKFSRYFDGEDDHPGDEYEHFVETLAFKVKPNPGINWYTSCLLRLEALGMPRPIRSPAKRFPLKPVGAEDYTHPSLYSQRK